MNHVLRPVSSLLWMLAQTAELTAWKWYLLIPFVIFIILAVLGLLRRGADARPRLWIPVLALPAIWISLGLWAGVLWASHFRDDRWLSYPPTAAICLSLVASVFFVTYQKGVRLFVASYSIINLTTVPTFVGTEAISS
jgi:hypothetical protein